MATWKKLTGLENNEVFLNLDNVLSLAWHEHGHGTIVTFASVEKDHIIVKEKPEEIIRADYRV
jgi:hypothetical protein